jgi:hypothetical protein
MKKLLSFLLVLWVFVPTHSGAEDFLGIPVHTDGQVITKTEERLVLKTRLTHDEMLAFYKDALKGLKDIKYRDWKSATYIEDDGSRPWHSITISKPNENGTRVVIVKDNWTWIIGTLLLRYVGVFVVLMVLLFAMALSGRIISSAVKRMEAKRTES